MASNRSIQKGRARSLPYPSKQEPTTGRVANSIFPVVAIGASAGGLEAYSELFRILPIDTGMAFVLVQHLDPQHHSMLSGILSKVTRMPVEEVQANSEIKPNRVYVIPPNAFMAIAQGRFVLTPRESARGQHLSVDFFMRSLAEDRQSSAIGVILSGTGSDGTAGVAAIKAEGGLNFAQDPATAKYDSMPRSAIASGCIDFVLTPRQIASELDRIKKHPYAKSSAGKAIDEEPPAAKDAFNQIIGLLRRNTGVDFSQYKPNTIHRRALRRMAILKLDSLDEYAKYLKENAEEAGNLHDDILINVTSFFRDLESFESLKECVYPTIAKDKGGNRSIRIWAPGCSTGEETYSLAITLLEFLGDRANDFQIQLFGTDLNEKGIQKARAGIYGERIADEISPERLKRFFVKVDDGYRVSKMVRDLCVFARQNVANDPPFSQMDLVACRNLLIYMGPTLQKKVIPILHYALRPNGFLFLGSSESISAFPSLFTTADKKHKIYSKNPIASRLHYDFSQTHYPTPSGVVAPFKKAQIQGEMPRELDLQAEADRIVLRNHAPVGVVINGSLDVVQFRGRTAPYLEPAPGKPTLNVLKLARNSLGRELRTLISAAKKKRTTIRNSSVLFEDEGLRKTLNVSVTPLGTAEEPDSPEDRFFLVLFEEMKSPATAVETPKLVKATSRETQRLKQELAAAQEALHAAIESEEATKEEFQSANEEILSANEELQSTNEELETSKEELQSANEELNTLNEELRHRNAELSELSNDISNLLNSTKFPVVMLDRDLRIRRMTPSAHELLKVSPSDVGRPISDIRLNIKTPELDSMIEKVLDDLQPVELEVQTVDDKWRSLSVLPYKTSDNRIDGVVLALQDIDRIKAANEQLKRSSEFLRAVIDTVRAPLLVLDPDSRVIAANAAFVKMWGVMSDQMIGKSMYRMHEEEWNIPKLRAALEQVLATQQPMNDLEVEHNFNGLGPKTILVNARTLMQPSQDAPMVLVAMEDITERKLAEAALIKSEKLAVAGRMAASLAHEINNPLQGVSNLLALLESSTTVGESDRLNISEIEKLLARVVYLTKQSLNFYRDSNRPEKVDVQEVLDGVLELYDGLLKSKNVAVKKQYSFDGALLSYAGELRQIFSTLLVNAIDSTDGNGAIAIRLAESSSWSNPSMRGIRVTVADNGKGLDPKYRTRIFDPFFTTKGEHGVGLGLWITNAIVSRLQGTIRVRSKTHGNSGTCFSVFLPSKTSQRVSGRLE